MSGMVDAGAVWAEGSFSTGALGALVATSAGSGGAFVTGVVVGKSAVLVCANMLGAKASPHSRAMMSTMFFIPGVLSWVGFFLCTGWWVDWFKGLISLFGGKTKFRALATGFDDDGVGFDFDAADMDAPAGGGDILFIAGGKGVVVDDDQLVSRRSRNAFENQRTQFHTVSGCSG